MSKVWSVEVTFRLPVFAETAEDAEEAARDEWATEEARANGLADAVAVASEVRAVPREWIGCLPWGGDGNTSIEDLVSR